MGDSSLLIHFLLMVNRSDYGPFQIVFFCILWSDRWTGQFRLMVHSDYHFVVNSNLESGVPHVVTTDRNYLLTYRGLLRSFSARIYY